ncbi:MurR/RpiR family transcriptional regulator [Nordella sp. HKS 07]|uniref:MurR/RpiR family transcriptional regulator n=1 Tax=Nordella sp. HKS 07 TaxID=2712222 RepID=UPI0013E12A1C|nr:MurR/RpiR family transcriptional regulator [Nordella sp. HKS 07]QIG47023.1 MurR/RpiR family transcriptional regulator [Nordella sp. HKS 07]
MTTRKTDKTETVAERLRLGAPTLTPAEHKLAHALLANYPVAGLSSITEFAKAARVSTPTALRLAKKLGFTGFPAFQAALRGEVSAQLKDPIARHQRWSKDAPEAHVLNRFADAVMENLRGSLKLVDHRSFDHIADFIADLGHAVHIVGGRITMPLAEYFHTHLHMIRPGVTLMPALPASWPQYVLNMDRGDVLIAFDVRRYDPRLAELANLAHQRRIRIVLFTDQWMSPIASIAAHSFPLRIEAPSGWDSNVATLFMIEALIADIVDRRWSDTEQRIRELEGITGRLRRNS